LAQPAQAKMARMNRTTPKTSVLRFKGIDLYAFIVRATCDGANRLRPSAGAEAVTINNR
jgi:hypothetical protein